MGEYVADKMQGRGCYTFADGRRYEGEYHANQKHGRGVYKWPSGLLFTGTWVRGAPLAGFLLFPGGECAKTSCTSASSSDASCPDVALMRLQEEAQTWIDARISRKAKSRGGRGGWTAVGAGEEDEEGGRAAQAGAGRGGGEAENEKKERWWGLVSGFAHKVPKA